MFPHVCSTVFSREMKLLYVEILQIIVISARTPIVTSTTVPTAILVDVSRAAYLFVVFIRFSADEDVGCCDDEGCGGECDEGDGLPPLRGAKAGFVAVSD